MTIDQLKDMAQSFSNSEITPALFIGHGSPMNAIEDNVYSRAWSRIGKEISKPNAILSISAHWCTKGTNVHVNQNPRVIYDFYGFPDELYEFKYPAPGSPDIAHFLQGAIRYPQIGADTEWGIDHGTWTVLAHMYPKADVPVFQLSIDLSQPPEYHYDLGEKLNFLRRKGVLIIGSGNIVHNLSKVNFSDDAEPFDWAVEFDEKVRSLIEHGNHKPLIDFSQLGEAARLSIPTPDHYYPLLYILGLRGIDDEVSFPVSGLTHGSLSMRAVLLQ